MIVEFGEEYLRDLYTKGECNDKKYRYRTDVIKRYKRGVDYLKWASRKEDLFRINSLNFEALRGDKVGRFSIRVNKQYRIEFTLRETDEHPILTICNIVELSNHYD
ncbi:MAG: type II toxin-antitoxin system RelE/ParE family toxin [Muribaculaceae bacterium]|nr:type II toxin-antitoxin system RelE/ParE family toxin [Muribaculaceae bacterium]